MKHLFYIISLVMMLFSSIVTFAQTPFDAFSPETSRPILDGDSIAAWRAEQHPDTVFCAIVADLHNEQLLLVDITTSSVLAYASFTDEIKNWISVDPLADKYIHQSPYLYCNGNPAMLVDPDGRAWKAQYAFNQNGDRVPNGFTWVSPELSYDAQGNLLPNLYEQAIHFSDNGSYNPKSRYNMGSSTATVYLQDGTTRSYDACTMPSNTANYATVPEGFYCAKSGMHNGKKSAYWALNMGDEVQSITEFEKKIELGSPNPSAPNRTYAQGINIHKPGLNNLTGMTNSGSPISEGCFLIDINEWSNFISNFQDGILIGISVSRTPSSKLLFPNTPYNFYLNVEDLTK